MSENINDLIKSVEALVYYSQIYTVKGASPVNMPDHESAWKAAQQWLWDNCKANEMGNYSLKTQPGPVWVKATTRLPLHKAFWNMPGGCNNNECFFPVLIDRKKYRVGEIFDERKEGASEPVYMFVIKGEDFYEKDFHRIEWLDENESPAEQPVVLTQHRADLIREVNGRDLDGMKDRMSLPTFGDVAKAFKWAAEYGNEKGAQLILSEDRQWMLLKKEDGVTETEELTPGNVAELYCPQKGFAKDEQSVREVDAVEFAEWAAWNWKRVEGKNLWENQKTLEILSTSKLYEKYKKEAGK